MRPFRAVVNDLLPLFKGILNESNKEHYDPFLWNYFVGMDTVQGLEKRVRFLYDLCRLARFDPNGKVILDAGCGFGRLSLILRAMGAKRVCGVDPAESWIRTYQLIIQDFGLSDCLEAYKEEASNTHFDSETFDMILSVEAISHYYEVEPVIKEWYRLLKKGGIVIISDGNNGANPKIMKELYYLWDRWENGPPGKVGIHTISEPYVEQRARLIQEAYPQIEETTVRELARRTSCLRWDAIAECVDNFLKTGQMPNHIYHQGQCPCEPDTGSRTEQAFDPRDLAQKLNDCGFQARYYAYFGGAGGNPIVRLVNAVGMALTPITISLATAFRIVAQKAR